MRGARIYNVSALFGSERVTSPASNRHQATRWPARGPARVLLVLDKPMLAELIKLTLNHGVYTTREVSTLAQVEASLSQWQPHMVILDMDLDGMQVLATLRAN